MDAINLKAGVTVQSLYSNLTNEQITKIEEASKDGFTEDELQKLENDGIDTSLIKKNAANGAAKKTDADVKSKAAELKAKYGTDGLQPTDKITKFGTALNDGLVQQLSEEGFDKMQIVDIVSQAFDGIGIEKNADGTYNCPRGHEYASIYDKFVSQMANLDNAELKEAKTKLASLNKEILNNNRKLKNLEYNITTLQQKIEDQISDAIEESEEITQEQKDSAKSLVSKRLNEYTSSNGKMTYEEFSSGLALELDTLAGTSNSKLSATVKKMLDAQSDMANLSGYLSNMNNLVLSNAKLSKEANGVQDQIAELKKKAAESSNAEDQCCKRTDPIGFTDGNTRYDFFVDKDSDGNITNENEFLGAEKGFEEMQEADADGDGKVTADELDSKNVKVVVTNADGSQEIKNASEVLKEGDSIDLTSYKSQNTEMSDGNLLQGTFNVNMNGKTMEGYQTLDNLDWLDNNYEFSDEVAGRGRFAQEQTEAVKAEDYDSKYNIFMSKYSELEELEAKALQTLGVDTQQVQSGISQMSMQDGASKGEVIERGFKLKAKKEAAEAKAEEEKEKKEAKAEEEAKKAEEEAKAQAAKEEEAKKAEEKKEENE